jgi:hypothetical protein
LRTGLAIEQSNRAVESRRRDERSVGAVVDGV